ncbi:LysR family transcriptional regulator [Verticiella sediminum]|uniref:LysR family transcriptional regulator n=1 Tax=Verticiella sediminum TaxID=1247510 RepID=A0A556A6I4_9BURK|nr:LysR family transcriptional regulator [Verticiella sediminum]TSH88510.1 LysR family transcriptional regulator [Verticiella sediminum]
MELRHLRYFAALAEELHFGRAARRLSITQPPLSASIRALEEELGVRLFERDSKQVTLTPAGAAFYQETLPVLKQVGLASAAARAMAQGHTGFLHVGFTGSMVYRSMPRIVTAFLAESPGVRLKVSELSSFEQADAIRRGHLHGGFFSQPSAPDGLASLALPDDQLVACVPSTHPLACETQVLVSALADEPFVIFSREAAPASYDNIISACTQAGFEPRTRYTARLWFTVVALVANGLGVALVPACIAQSGIAGARFIPLAETTLRSGGFFAWNTEHVTPPLEAFIAHAAGVLDAA